MRSCSEARCNDVGAYAGTHAHVEPCWSWPKPVQQPRPPIHIGARATKAVFADIAAYGDGWLPIAGYGDVISHIPKLRRAFEVVDRSPEQALVSVYHAPADLAILEQYREAGVNRAVLSLDAVDEDDVLRQLDAQTASVSAFMN
ncbi:MAG: LLM class flavin-dependent oxidoreductase [Halioglobus sp.]|nr:LLM class flavin-dependent oxidoreductase [Halioglobus sp.]